MFLVETQMFMATLTMMKEITIVSHHADTQTLLHLRKKLPTFVLFMIFSSNEKPNRKKTIKISGILFELAAAECAH